MDDPNTTRTAIPRPVTDISPVPNEPPTDVVPAPAITATIDNGYKLQRYLIEKAFMTSIQWMR
jgi:hypothetical protein